MIRDLYRFTLFLWAALVCTTVLVEASAGPSHTIAAATASRA